MLFCVSIIAMPADSSLMGTPTNLGWFLALWLVLLSMMRLPRSTWACALLAGAASSATFSTPMSPITAPVWFLRATRAVRRGATGELLVSGGVLVSTAVLFGLAASLGVEPRPAAFSIGRYLDLVSLRLLEVLVGPRAVATLGPTAGVIAFVASAGVVVLIAVGTARSGPHTRTVVLACAYYAVSSLLLLAIGRAFLGSTDQLMLRLVTALPVRYGLVASAMLLPTALRLVDQLPSAPTRRALIATYVAGAGLAWRGIIRPAAVA